jgi:CheY-like chemotaxis protein
MGSSTLHNVNRITANPPAWPADIERSIRDYLNRVNGNCELLKLDAENYPTLARCFDQVRKGVILAFQEAQAALASGEAIPQLLARVEGALDQVNKSMEEIQNQVRSAPDLHMEDDLLELEFSLYHFSRVVRESMDHGKNQPVAGAGEADERTVAEQRPVILVADDDESNRDLLGRLLRMEKYHVLFATNGREVLEKLAVDSIDLLLLDLVMPGASGFEVLRSARATEAGREVPIVMISGVDETDKVVAFQCHFASCARAHSA